MQSLLYTEAQFLKDNFSESICFKELFLGKCFRKDLQSWQIAALRQMCQGLQH